MTTIALSLYDEFAVSLCDGDNVLRESSPARECGVNVCQAVPSRATRDGRYTTLRGSPLQPIIETRYVPLGIPLSITATSDIASPYSR